MGRKKKLKKEEIAEDWCFVCKDGGTLRICDFKDCLKAYHPECVEKDDSLLQTDEKWICDLHFCSECNKAPKFYCLCCPNAICGHCLYDAEFAIVKGKKGLCNSCLELALLIEEKKDVDSKGHRIDFISPHTAEFYFHGYWEIIKEKEHLTSEHVISANKKLKRAVNYACESDSDECDEDEEDIDDSENENQIRKRKRSKEKPSAIKRKGRSNKKEFIGWGSKPLLEFLASIGKDTTEILSHSDVTTVVNQYCKENNLFHPERKRKIICDARLQALFGRKSVNKNSIFKLLASHLAENMDESDDEFGFSSENEDEYDMVASKRKLLASSFNKSQSKKVILDVQKSRFASIVPKNIKLVYLRKSLVEELSKHLETFDAKVMGSFVRVRSDPNDYLQKNSHQLVQVIGINKTTSMNLEIVLQVSNMVKGVPICKLSDDDFSEEECEDLFQRVKSGLLKRPTVVELGQKAKSLHEDIIKHWIARELVLLQKRIDKANEKGWRRELYEYMDRLLLLQKPSEQARFLSEIPEVIADIGEFEPICEDSVREDENERKDKLPESAPMIVSESPSCNLKFDGISCCLKDSTNVAAVVTKGETQTFITSDQQCGDESHNGTTGLLPTPALQPSGRKAQISAAGCSAADGDTQTIISSDQQYGDESHNGTTGLLPTALQPSGCEAQNTAADCLAAEGSNDMRKEGGEEDKDVDKENGSKIETCNGSPPANDSHKHACIDQTNEFKCVIKDMHELGENVKEMRKELKDLREDMQIQLNS